MKIEFTPKQLECMPHLVKGLSNKEIAKEMKISTSTVENHIEYIRQKTGCIARANIIEYIKENRILEKFIHQKKGNQVFDVLRIGRY